MKCPRCVQPVVPATPYCVRCGFALPALHPEFGSEAVHLERLCDAAHCLRLREKDALNSLLDDFEREFPQLFAAVYLGALPEMTSIRQFGFWLLNHAAVTPADVSRPNEQGILIVVDLQSRVIGVTLGYMLENFVSEKDLERCMRAARLPLFNGEFSRGVTVFLKRLRGTLRKASRRAKRHPEKFAPPPAPLIGKPLFTQLKGEAPSSPPVSIGDDAGVEPHYNEADLDLTRPE